MSAQRETNRIPLYGPDRKLRAWITTERAEQLERARLVNVVRSRKGRLCRYYLLSD